MFKCLLQCFCPCIFSDNTIDDYKPIYIPKYNYSAEGNRFIKIIYYKIMYYIDLNKYFL